MITSEGKRRLFPPAQSLAMRRPRRLGRKGDNKVPFALTTHNPTLVFGKKRESPQPRGGERSKGFKTELICRGKKNLLGRKTSKIISKNQERKESAAQMSMKK